MTNLLKHPGVLTIGYLLLRLILSPLSPVPGAVALDPLWIFAVLLHRNAGRGWMFSLIPGLVFGDWMCSMAGGQILMRMAGFIVLGTLITPGGFHREYVVLILNHALWSSLMPDWIGHYPLGYLYIVWVLQGVLWWGLAAPRKEEKSLKPIGALLLVPVALILLHLFLPASPLWPIPQLGSHSGLLLQIFAGLLILPPVVPWVLKLRHPPAAGAVSGTSGGRWTHLAE